jgi:hypothetical protein
MDAIPPPPPPRDTLPPPPPPPEEELGPTLVQPKQKKGWGSQRKQPPSIEDILKVKKEKEAAAAKVSLPLMTTAPSSFERYSHRCSSSLYTNLYLIAAEIS